MTGSDGDTDIDWSNIDEYDAEELEEIDQARREEWAEKYAELTQSEEEAVATLRESAQESLETETVTIPGGTDLEVRTRIPPTVEDLLAEVGDAEAEQDMQRARRLTCQAVAALVESPEAYASAQVWLTASRDGAAGMQWLAESLSAVLEPAEESAAALTDEGNRHSGATPSPTGDKQSGWQRQR